MGAEYRVRGAGSNYGVQRVQSTKYGVPSSRYVVRSTERARGARFIVRSTADAGRGCGGAGVQGARRGELDSIRVFVGRVLVERQ